MAFFFCKRGDLHSTLSPHDTYRYSEDILLGGHTV